MRKIAVLKAGGGGQKVTRADLGRRAKVVTPLARRQVVGFLQDGSPSASAERVTRWGQRSTVRYRRVRGDDPLREPSAGTGSPLATARLPSAPRTPPAGRLGRQPQARLAALTATSSWPCGASGGRSVQPAAGSGSRHQPSRTSAGWISWATRWRTATPPHREDRV